MPAFGADGFVQDVTLRTVVVQNFDKTIVTVPTYKMVSEPFRNWRGMVESGGRRMKRALFIDQSSVRFLSSDEVARFSQLRLIHNYMAKKLTEIEAHNRAVSTSNAGREMRRLTNLGTFRAYADAYLRQHSQLATEGMPYIVRQLAPGPNGLPIELYAFVADTDWATYEAVQADVFDHLIAMAPEFGLRLHQEAMAPDLRNGASIEGQGDALEIVTSSRDSPAVS